MPEETTSQTPEKVSYFNPCRNDKVGDILAWLTEGTDCRCCIGARIVGAFLFGLVIASTCLIAFLR